MLKIGEQYGDIAVPDKHLGVFTYHLFIYEGQGPDGAVSGIGAENTPYIRIREHRGYLLCPLTVMPRHGPELFEYVSIISDPESEALEGLHPLHETLLFEGPGGGNHTDRVTPSNPHGFVYARLNAPPIAGAALKTIPPGDAGGRFP